VSGWAVCATGVARIGVTLDGEAVGSTELGLSRPDVGEEYPAIPQARHAGFRLTHQLAAPVEGARTLTIRIHNGLDDVREMTQTVTVATQAEVASSPVPSAPDDSEEFRFELDHPTVIN